MATAKTIIGLGAVLALAGQSGCQEQAEEELDPRSLGPCSDYDINVNPDGSIGDGRVDSGDLNAFGIAYNAGEADIYTLNGIGVYWQQSCEPPPRLFSSREELMAVAIAPLEDVALEEGIAIRAADLSAMRNGELFVGDYDFSRPVIEPSGAVRMPRGADVEAVMDDVHSCVDDTAAAGMDEQDALVECLAAAGMFNRYNDAHMSLVDHYLGTEIAEAGAVPGQDDAPEQESRCVSTCEVVGNRSSSSETSWSTKTGRLGGYTTPGPGDVLRNHESVASAHGLGGGFIAGGRTCSDRVLPRVQCTTVAHGPDKDVCDGAFVNVYGYTGADYSISQTVQVDHWENTARSVVNLSASVFQWPTAESLATSTDEERPLGEPWTITDAMFSVEAEVHVDDFPHCEHGSSLLADLWDACDVEFIASAQTGGGPTSSPYRLTARLKCSGKQLLANLWDDAEDHFDTHIEGEGDDERLVINIPENEVKLCTGLDTNAPGVGSRPRLGRGAHISFADDAHASPQFLAQVEELMAKRAQCLEEKGRRPLSPSPACDAYSTLLDIDSSLPIELRPDGDLDYGKTLGPIGAEQEVFNAGTIPLGFFTSDTHAQSSTSVESVFVLRAVQCVKFRPDGETWVDHDCSVAKSPADYEDYDATAEIRHHDAFGNGSMSVSARCFNGTPNYAHSNMDCQGARFGWSRTSTQLPEECSVSTDD